MTFLASSTALADGVHVGVAVLDVLCVPAQGVVAGLHVLCEGDVGVAVDGDLHRAAGERCGGQAAGRLEGPAGSRGMLLGPEHHSLQVCWAVEPGKAPGH